jgi:hypothetical protein
MLPKHQNNRGATDSTFRQSNRSVPILAGLLFIVRSSLPSRIVRDVSTPLDMTKDALRSSISHEHHRVQSADLNELWKAPRPAKEASFVRRPRDFLREIS